MDMEDTGPDGADRLRALFAAEGEKRAMRRGERLHAAGDPSAHAFLIGWGWIGRTRSTVAGDAAFTGIYMANDVVGADGAFREQVDDDLQALTDGSLWRLPAAALAAAAARGGAVAAALLRLMAADAALVREALFAVGRLSAAERLSTLVLQTRRRQIEAGLIAPGARAFRLPLSQPQLAAATGVTAVHVNRVLQALRALGCLEMRDGLVRIHDLPMLEREARAGSVRARGGARRAEEGAAAE